MKIEMRSHGFTLLEVLIAVVVFSTGLLALAALQGNLARASADAKIQTQVAAFMQARMDQLRALGYYSVDDATDSCAANTGATDGSDFVPASFCTQNALSAFTLTQEVDIWTSAVGASSFAIGVPADPNDPQFKRVVLRAQWTDATGATRRMSMTSDLSELSLKDGLAQVPDETSSYDSIAPLVRQDSPATAGVIPIALGDGSSSAASNPTPELVGKKNNQAIVGTRFNVLTYAPSGAGYQIQRRFENQVVKCSCSYGEGGANLDEAWRTPQWPAIWTGERYEVFRPADGATAPGARIDYPAGPTPGVEQSPLCQECCRDHHDNEEDTPRFDPERNFEASGYDRYRRDNDGLLIQASNASGGEYLASCRMIRVDGFWRTASDMYQRHFGLLETTPVANVEAKSGLVTSNATAAYETFVKDYLDAYAVDGDGTAPGNATELFDAIDALNEPEDVDIATPNNSDYRYLHGRGLYVDYLEESARDWIADKVDDCAPSTPLADCVLPYLPFTSINLTEIADWTAADPAVLLVNSGNLLASNPSEPSGGRSIGRKDGETENVATIRASNSGVAVSSLLSGGVDPEDESEINSDAQLFVVGDGGDDGGDGGDDEGEPSTGDNFRVLLDGGGQNPFVFYSLPSDAGECLKQSGSRDHVCGTDTDLSAGASGSVRLERYWIEGSTSRSFTVNPNQCTVNPPNGNPPPFTGGTFAVTGVPEFRNQAVAGVSVEGAGTAGPPNSPVNNNTGRETTTIPIYDFGPDSRLVVTIVDEGDPQYATIGSCTVNGTKSGNNYGWTLVVDTWTRPWE